MTYKLVLAVTILFSLSVLADSAAGQTEGGAIAAVDEPSEGGGSVVSRSPVSSKTVSKVRTSNPQKVSAKAPTARPKPRKWDGFVIGDEYTFLNFEVISAEKPYHTRDAKAGGAAGLVQVEILIETNGTVVAAKARTGNKLLHPEAERAALASRFNRPSVYGKPARAIGFLVYRFGPSRSE